MTATPAVSAAAAAAAVGVPVSAPRRWLLILLTVFTVVLIRPALGDNTYLVVASRFIETDVPYTVTVTISDRRSNDNISSSVSGDNSDAVAQIVAHIAGRTRDGRVQQLEQTVDVKTGSTAIQFDNVDQLSPGDYTLLVSGRGAVKFRSQWPLIYRQQRQFSPLIQLDKSVYSPGDTVQFRVVTTDRHQLLLRQLVPLDVRVTDGKNNGIRMWNGLRPENGVVQLSLPLADTLNYGDWTISVHSGGQVSGKVFSVAEYVLPRFQVSVSLPAYVLLSARTVTATVTASYASGLPVSGQLMVRAYAAIRSDQLQPLFLDQVRRHVAIDGSVQVTFDIADDLDVVDDYASRLVFNVMVVESSTGGGGGGGGGLAQNATGFTTLYRSPYRLQLLPTASHFKPTLPFTVYLLASRQPGVEPSLGLGEVTVRHSFCGGTNFTGSTHPVPDSGLLQLTYTPPRQPARSCQLLLEAEYAGVRYTFPPIGEAVSPAGAYLSLTVNEVDSVRVGRPMVVSLASSVSITTFFYRILSADHGPLLVGSGTGGGSSSYDFRLRVSEQMYPQATVLIYFTLDSGEIVADSLTFAVQSSQLNEVSLSVDKSVVAPGEDTLISIAALPGSHVLLMAVDDELSAVQGDNDITEQLLQSQLDSGQKSTAEQTDTQLLSSQSGQRTVLHTGGATASDVFKNAALLTITNGELLQLAEDTTASVHNVTGVKAKLAPAVAYAPRLPTVEAPAPAAEKAAAAGPFAFSGLAPPFYRHRRLHLLTAPLSTWLFESVTVPRSGQVKFRRRAPVQSGVWRLTAVALHGSAPTAVLPSAVTLRVARPLQLAVNSANQLRLGEVIGVQCVVTNVRHTSLPVTVTLEHGGEWRRSSSSSGARQSGQSGDTANATTTTTTTAAPLELFERRRVSVLPGAVASVLFLLEPVGAGQLPLRVEARTDFDTIRADHFVNVKHEGVEEEMSVTRLIDSPRVEFNTTIAHHRSLVPGSDSLLLRASSHILGITVRQLVTAAAASKQLLIQLPTDCGEQQLLQLAAAVLVLQLKQLPAAATPQLDEQLQLLLTAARQQLAESYQRQLSYRLQDGSFAIFPDQDDQGSVWLTALSVRWLLKAAQFVYVDELVISSGISYLTERQQANGSFVETAVDVYSASQSVECLTPLVLITLLESQQQQQQQQQQQRTDVSDSVSRAVQYLVRQLPEKSARALAVTCYALTVAGHPAARSAHARLMAMAQQQQQQDGMLWWRDSLAPSIKNTSHWFGAVRAADIEATSYALLTMIQRADSASQSSTAETITWLVQQMTSRGGFVSSQDTVVALTALAAAAEAAATGGVTSRSEPVEVAARMVTANGATGSLTLDGRQQHPLAVVTAEIGQPAEGAVVVQASGGRESDSSPNPPQLLLQLVHRYRVLVSAPSPSFYLSPRVEPAGATGPGSWRHLKLNICLAWRWAGAASYMVVVQVALPSGFTADRKTLPGVYRHPHVRHARLSADRTQVFIYFDKITEYEVCPTVLASLTTSVANHKSAAVTVYDYYDTTRLARQFYRPNRVEICDLCATTASAAATVGQCSVDDCDAVPSGQRLRSASVEDVTPSRAGPPLRAAAPLFTTLVSVIGMLHTHWHTHWHTAD